MEPQTGLTPELVPWMDARDVVHYGDGKPSVRKAAALGKQAVDTDRRTVEAVISTGAVDRQGDTVDPMGWQLDSYMKNPVVLWAHDYRSLPVAKALSVEVKGSGKRARLKAKARFETFPFADAVFNLIASGTINATSVGFVPLEWKFAEEDEDRGFFALDITKQELLEYSIVPVPANAEALIGAKELNPDHRFALYHWIAEAVEDDRQLGGLEHKDLDKIHRAWAKEVSYHCLGAQTLDIAERNLARIRTASSTSTLDAPVAIPTAWHEADEAAPKSLSPEATMDVRRRLMRLRLDTHRRGDSTLQ